MVIISRLLLIAALVAGWFGPTARAFTAVVAPVIKDEANLFSAEALDQANRKIKEISRHYGKDLLIETVPGIPKELQEKYKELGKRAFFVDWADKRATDAVVHGIYILICKDPGHLQIEVDKDTRRKAFTLEDRDRLVKKMLEKFEDKSNPKHFDAGLLAGIEYVEATLHANVGKRSTSNENIPWEDGRGRVPAQPGGMSILGWVGVGLVVLLGVWLLFGLIRAFSGGGGGGGYGPGGYGGGGGGGGGFFSSLLGGMFGAAAGMWMYDRFFGGGNAWGASAPSPGYGSSVPDNTGAGDFGGDTGGGGDFGDNGGGGGGGDFGDNGGGGDFGGGGGDFGGGGDMGGGDMGGGGDF